MPSLFFNYFPFVDFIPTCLFLFFATLLGKTMIVTKSAIKPIFLIKPNIQSQPVKFEAPTVA